MPDALFPVADVPSVQGVFRCSRRILVVLFCSCSHERFGIETKSEEKAISWDVYKMEQDFGGVENYESLIASQCMISSLSMPVSK